MAGVRESSIVRQDRNTAYDRQKDQAQKPRTIEPAVLQIRWPQIRPQRPAAARRLRFGLFAPGGSHGWRLGQPTLETGPSFVPQTGRGTVSERCPH